MKKYFFSLYLLLGWVTIILAQDTAVTIKQGRYGVINHYHIDNRYDLYCRVTYAKGLFYGSSSPLRPNYAEKDSQVREYFIDLYARMNNLTNIDSIRKSNYKLYYSGYPRNSSETIEHLGDLYYHDNWLVHKSLILCRDKMFLSRRLIENDSTVKTITNGLGEIDPALSIYTNGQHNVFEDLFYIKPQMYKQEYYRGKYIADYTNAGGFIGQLDSMGYLYNDSSYIVFYYKFTKVEDKSDYTYVGFCPKLGIVYLYYYTEKFTFVLKDIDGIPLEEYVRKNICITPFCEVY